MSRSVKGGHAVVCRSCQTLAVMINTTPDQEPSTNPEKAVTAPGGKPKPSRGVDHLFHEDLVKFYKDVDETLTTLQADFLSESTRKEQRILLALSFLLLLLARGTIEVEAKPTAELVGLKLALNFGGTLVLLGGVVCSFFLLTYAIRAYADWTTFSIRRARSEAEIAAITSQLDDLWDGKEPRPFEEAAGSFLYRARAAFDQKPVDWGSYNEERSAYNRRVWGLATKRLWVVRQVTRVRRTRWLRFTFELLFPVVFGFVALLEAYRRVIA